MRQQALIALAFVACRPAGRPPAPSSDRAADTLRGTLVVEGSEPFQVAAVRTADGRVVIDSASPALLKLQNLDVWLRGARTGADRFRVDGYRIRSANGTVAWDGILRGDSGNLRLELQDGTTRAIHGAPAGFERFIGSRIWLTENSDGTLREYGIL